MTVPSGSHLGPYEVIAHLGSGGMGDVYRARDTKLNRDVALKVLPEAFAADPERLARFTREAQTLAALNHPHIAHIYGLDRQERLYGQERLDGQERGASSFIVMELVEGETLAQKLEQLSRVKPQRSGLALDEALPIARQIAEALEAAHEKGIIHRDLKPANIMLTADGLVKVLDFGLAKALGGGAAEAAPYDSPSVGRPFRGADAANSPTITTPAMMTGVGVILGTAAYMSPEQAKGRAVDKRSDV